MSDIMSDISTGIDKVVNDVAIASKAAAEASLELLGDAAVQYAFNLLFEALI